MINFLHGKNISHESYLYYVIVFFGFINYKYNMIRKLKESVFFRFVIILNLLSFKLCSYNKNLATSHGDDDINDLT